MRYLAALLFYVLGLMEMALRAVLAVVLTLGTLFFVPIVCVEAYTDVLQGNLGFRFADRCLDAA